MPKPRPTGRVWPGTSHSAATLCPAPSWRQLCPGVHPSLGNNQSTGVRLALLLEPEEGEGAVQCWLFLEPITHTKLHQTPRVLHLAYACAACWERCSVETNNTALCLICKETVSAFKDYNLKGHYLQKHAAKFDAYQGMLCKDKTVELKSVIST